MTKTLPRTGKDNWMDRLKFDGRGLLPAVVQDADSQKVLMLAYMNLDSLQKTLETGQTWFWSRSRNELWNKGATSGHVQNVKSIAYDCDADTLLVGVEQIGAACHTGEYSCFYEQIVGDESNRSQQQKTPSYEVLDALIETIDQRYLQRPEGAYTTYLFEKGLDKILKKIGEESTEVVIAGKNEDQTELICEAGDLIYHLFVLLRQRDIPFEAVLTELETRHRLNDNPNKVK